MTADPHRIADIAGLEALYGETNPISIAKETRALTPEYRRWIERAPFLALATSGPGGLDVSPRGDAVGELLRVLDDRTLAMPDRRGNNRLDSLRNIVADPRVGLLFLIPGIAETLRVNGRAHLTTDPALLRSFTVDGRVPRTVIVIRAEAIYFQCARALLRSGLWSAGAQAAASEVPTAGQMTRAALPSFDADGYDEGLRPRQRGSLY